MSYTWSGTKPRLTRITDTATGREITLTYGTGSAGPSGGPCASGAPRDFLCEVLYWDNTSTKFSYVTSGPAASWPASRIPASPSLTSPTRRPPAGGWSRCARPWPPTRWPPPG